MHIVIEARNINSSTGRYIERLVTYLQKIDTTNTYSILVPTKDKDFWKPTAKNFSVRTIDFDNYSFGEQLGFKRYLKKLKPDLVHFTMPQQPIFYRGKSVTTFHDLTLLKTWNTDKNWLVYHIKQLVGRFAFYYTAHNTTRIIVPSQYTKRDLLSFSGITPSKITVTYEAADVSPTRPRVYKTPFSEFLLYVGQQADYKNIRRLAEAHQRLLLDHPTLGLILAGRLKDDAKANQAFFKKQGYKNIHFTDYISDEERDWLYAHCAAYCFPSLMEGFGLPGLEAMTYGAPVVASNATCIPEILGDAALYFDPNNTDDMAQTIGRVLDDPTLRKELIDRGYRQIKKYSWKRMAQQTHDVYTRAINSKG